MKTGNVKIRRALLSVSDKTGLMDFAQGLAGFGVEIISTGGTASALRAAGIFVTDVSAFTNFPEMFDGRVKTLHPKVHGGLLFIRSNAEHEAMAAHHGIQPIDLVVVNLYPFEETVKKPNVSFAEAIEQIDIGGPAMLRSAAKNHESVTVVVDPSEYTALLEEMADNGGCTVENTRLALASKVFEKTSQYDHQIQLYLVKTLLGE